MPEYLETCYEVLDLVQEVLQKKLVTSVKGEEA
jgi:hypothetical protein